MVGANGTMYNEQCTVVQRTMVQFVQSQMCNGPYAWMVGDEGRGMGRGLIVKTWNMPF